MNDLSGTTLGQYQLIEVIGKGGMATVYRAYQPSMEREVAVKVMSPDLADEAEFITRFRREAQIIAQLQHPHILAVYDFGEQGRFVYLVMRLMMGGTLANELQGRPLPVERVILLVRQIASALDYAHGQGVIHRDLKPSNVLLDSEGNASLTDFGIAKMVIGGAVTGLTSPGSVIGTPTYMAPEQWRSEPVDARTDVYALGVMIYQMLLGKVPFAAETPHGLMYQHLDQQPPPPRAVDPNLPPGVEPVLLRALAKHRHDRYSSAGELAADLEHVLHYPGRLPEQTAFNGLPGRPSADEQAIEDELMGMPPVTSPTLPPPSAPATLRSIPQPPPASGEAQAPVRVLTPPRRPTPSYDYEPPLQPGQQGYTPPYQAPPPEPPRAYAVREGGGAGRFLGILAAIIAAMAVFGLIVLVVALIANPGGDNGDEPEPTSGPVQPTRDQNNPPPPGAPVAVITAPPGSSTYVLGDTVSIQFNVTGGMAITRVELTRFGQVLQSVDAGGQSSFGGTFLYQPDSTGAHVIEIVPWSGSVRGTAAAVTVLVQ